MPDWKRIVEERLPADLGLVEEIAQHLEDRYRVLCSGGASEEEAYRLALAELADLSPMKPVLDKRRPGMAQGLWSDIRYALAAARSIQPATRTPGFRDRLRFNDRHRCQPRRIA